MKFNSLSIFISFLFLSTVVLQSHSDGRANRDRDNTGAPGGQMGGNGLQITCQNCHENGNFEVGINLELLDENDVAVSEFIPNNNYTAKVTIEKLSGEDPDGYGFQMVSLVDANDSDVNGWVDGGFSSNIQLILANSTGRVYAEHHSISESNEFTAQWKAPDVNTGDVSFYIAGVGVNANGGSTGDHAATPIKVTFSESSTTSLTDLNASVDINVFPNPTVDYIAINCELESYVVEIFQNGRIVNSIVSNRGNSTIRMEELSTGVFYVRIKDENNQVVGIKKVVKI